MNWQEICVYLIVAVCLFFAGRAVYRKIRRVNHDDNPCIDCPAPCALKEAVMEKKNDCERISKQKKQKK